MGISTTPTQAARHEDSDFATRCRARITHGRDKPATRGGPRGEGPDPIEVGTFVRGTAAEARGLPPNRSGRVRRRAAREARIGATRGRLANFNPMVRDSSPSSAARRSTDDLHSSPSQVPSNERHRISRRPSIADLRSTAVRPSTADRPPTVDRHPTAVRPSTADPRRFGRRRSIGSVPSIGVPRSRLRPRSMRLCSAETRRNSSPGAGRSRRRLSHADRPSGSSSSRSGARRSSGSCCTPRTSASRSWRWKAGR